MLLGKVHFTTTKLKVKKLTPKMWMTVLLFSTSILPLWSVKRQQIVQKNHSKQWVVLQKRTVYPIFSLRNERKKKKMKKHEKEKEFMKSLKAVSVTTSYCGTAGSESEESGDSENSEDELSEPDNYISNLTDSSDDNESLYFLYDCEGTGGSVYKDHIVEIAAVLQPLPGNVETNIPSTFQSLINTSKRIATPG